MLFAECHRLMGVVNAHQCINCDASTELQTHNTFNTKHITYSTKQRSKC
jgi:hypothetical protein